jgi:hypothetical protein
MKRKECAGTGGDDGERRIVTNSDHQGRHTCCRCSAGCSARATDTRFTTARPPLDLVLSVVRALHALRGVAHRALVDRHPSRWCLAVGSQLH